VLVSIETNDPAVAREVATIVTAAGHELVPLGTPGTFVLAVVDEAAVASLLAHEGGPPPLREADAMVVWPHDRAVLALRLRLTAHRWPGPSRANEERFRIALESSRNIVYEWEIHDGAVRHFGPKAAPVGPAPVALPTTRADWEARIHPDDRARVLQAIERHLSDGVPFGEEYRFAWSDGQWRRWIDRGRVLFGHDGRPQRMVGACTDVTEQRDLEERLAQSRKMEAVGQLAGGVAHDFNNLLLAILNNIDYALEAIAPGQVRRDLEDARQAAERGAELTRQLLAFSRRQVLHAQNLSLNHVIVRVMRMLRRILGPEIRFVFKPGHDIGTVHADPGQLEQILVNLIVNARDAMPDGGKVTIATGPHELGPTNDLGLPPGLYSRLVVADTGTGIPPDVLPHIFEPFYTTKGSGRGTGLGLPTVYGIVQQHGGGVRVDSSDEGTTFDVVLPTVSDAAATVAIAEPVPEPPGGSETVLIAEDNPHVRELTRRVLTEAGYTVLAAEDGLEACALFEERRAEVDLVLLDAVMPRMGGRTAHERMSALVPEMRFAFVSGYSTDVLDGSFLEAHDVRLLPKPYRRAELLAFVREELDR
jgi:signal transduction histidine kinase/CheY-like chemotaxis protein